MERLIPRSGVRDVDIALEAVIMVVVISPITATTMIEIEDVVIGMMSDMNLADVQEISMISYLTDVRMPRMC
jgi:hypothetical protein